MSLNIQNDILWAIEAGIARSYSELNRFLRAYASHEIASEVNKLIDAHRVVMSPDGFEIVGEDTTDQAESIGSQNRIEQPESLESKTISDSSFLVTDRNKSIVPAQDKVDRASGESEVTQNPDNVTVSSQTQPNQKESDASALSEEMTLLSQSKGALKTMTPLAFLEFPSHIMSSLTSKGIECLYQLVEKLPSLDKSFGIVRLSQVIEKLNNLSGEPPLNLSRDQIDTLKILSGSSLFYFDIFGVLVSDMPKGISAAQIRANLMDGTYNTSMIGSFSYAEYASGFSNISFEAVKKINETMKSRGYPVNGDAFNIYALPLVEESFKAGEFNDVPTASHDAIQLLIDLPTTKKACFGTLRDDFLALLAKADGLGSSERIKVNRDDAFIEAATMLSFLIQECRFDMNALTLQCLPSRER